jgi:hypothetical protein
MGGLECNGEGEAAWRGSSQVLKKRWLQRGARPGNAGWLGRVKTAVDYIFVDIDSHLLDRNL